MRHIKARLMGEVWEPVIVEVTLESGKKISIESPAGGNEAAPFVPKSETKPPEQSSPPPDINLPVPPADTPDKT